MKLLQIAHGALPIPPTGWGAVESMVWGLKEHLERVGHTIDIANTRDIHDVIAHANRRAYDFVHVHNELFVLECVAHLTRPFAVTSHHGGLHVFDPDRPERLGGLAILFEDMLRAPANIVLSEAIRRKYALRGYTGYLRVHRFGVDTDRFRWTAHGNGKAVCVGALSLRKRQAWLADIARDRVAVDFVGPWDTAWCPEFVPHARARYLGAWDRATIYERLTEYSCLTLLSRSEAAPRVVPEALAAGLSIVVSEACAANLTDESFVTIIPDHERRPEAIADAIQSAIDRNDGLRASIRAYAIARFGYASTIPDYLDIVDHVRAATPAAMAVHARSGS